MAKIKKNLKAEELTFTNNYITQSANFNKDLYKITFSANCFNKDSIKLIGKYSVEFQGITKEIAGNYQLGNSLRNEFMEIISLELQVLTDLYGWNSENSPYYEEYKVVKFLHEELTKIMPNYKF